MICSLMFVSIRMICWGSQRSDVDSKESYGSRTENTDKAETSDSSAKKSADKTETSDSADTTKSETKTKTEK